MTTLVTGGNGWLPCHVVRRLARRGEPVVSFDLQPVDPLLTEFLADALPAVRFEHGDITDPARLGEVVERHNVDHIIHAAAITPRVDRERREPTRIVDVNLGGTLNALDVALQRPSFGRFVQISSCAVWGDVPGVTTLDETSPTNPSGLYGITKLAGEQIAIRYHELFDLDVVAIRPGNLYGPMERPTPGYAGATELREMLRLHAAGQPVRVTSLAGPYLDWTFVEDAAEGIERLWAAPAPAHRLYSLTCGKLFSIGDILAAFARHLPGFRYQVVPTEQANIALSGAPPGPVPSNTRLHAHLDWSPTTTLDAGLTAYLAWINHHGPQ